MLKVSLYFDGASKGNPGPAGAGAVIFKNSAVAEEIKKFIGVATNNQAEYTALILGLEGAHSLGATEVDVYSDSQLVVRQLNGEYQIKDQKLRELYDRVVEKCRSFEKIKFQHIPREKNKHADSLANQGVKEANPKSISSEEAKTDGLEFCLNSNFFIPHFRKFFRELLQERKIASREENVQSVLSAIDALERENEKTTCVRFTCDSQGINLEIK